MDNIVCCLSVFFETYLGGIIKWVVAVQALQEVTGSTPVFSTTKNPHSFLLYSTTSSSTKSQAR
jgi:hypothetical protein